MRQFIYLLSNVSFFSPKKIAAHIVSPIKFRFRIVTKNMSLVGSIKEGKHTKLVSVSFCQVIFL